MIVNDTAKSDLILIALGFLAAIMFYWLYSEVHPFSIADNKLGDEIVQQYSAEELARLGYSAVDESYPSFRIRTTLLDSLQKTGDIQELYSDSLIRSLYPAFYWRVNHRVQLGEMAKSLSGFDSEEANINIFLSENGTFLGVQNPSNVFPNRILTPSILTEVIPSIEPFLSELRSDSLILEKLQFNFDSGFLVDEDFVFDLDVINYLGRQEAQAFAEIQLESSGWPVEFLELDDLELISVNRINIARAVYKTSLPDFENQLNITLDFLPTGALINMNYSQPVSAAAGQNFDQIRTGVLVLFILIFLLWILVILFIRIRLRLIDTKLSVLIAVLAGFAIPFMLFLQWLYEINTSFDPFEISVFFWHLFGMGITAAFVSILFFSITAIGDSITRDHWASKLRTFDLLRIGHIYNRPMGLVLVRSVSYSFLFAFLWAVSFHIFPNAIVTIGSSTFDHYSLYLPFIGVPMGQFFVSLVFAQALYLILIGKFSSYSKNPILIGGISALVFMIINPVSVSVAPISFEIMISAFIGFIFGWIYVREDFLTVMLTLFLLITHIFTADGWTMTNSPDASLFYTASFLVLFLFGLGGLAILRGKSVRELPNYIPDYISELARDERIKQELQIARKVQQSFLPIETPNIPGVDVAAICTPAHETGGDYYDFIPLDSGEYAVTIGDVSGKGIQAAFYMTFTKGVLHALCTEFRSTIDTLSSVNMLFRRNAGPGTFISLIFGILNPADNTFRFSRAGHNPLLFYCSKEKTLKEYRPDGIGLGMANDEIFRNTTKEVSLELASGDILILFTDGVVEATNQLDKFYGDNRLHEVIKMNKNLNAKEIVRKLSDDLKQFGDGSALHDDMTILVIKKD